MDKLPSRSPTKVVLRKARVGYPLQHTKIKLHLFTKLKQSKTNCIFFVPARENGVKVLTKYEVPTPNSRGSGLLRGQPFYVAQGATIARLPALGPRAPVVPS